MSTTQNIRLIIIIYIQRNIHNMHMHTIVVLEYQRQYAYEIVLYIILANMHTTLVEYARIYRMHSTVCILLLDLLAT